MQTCLRLANELILCLYPGPLRRVVLTPAAKSVIWAVLATIGCFLADLVLPRGATPAIGYALVPILASGTRRWSFVLGMTGVCTVLTWIGFFLEPAGAPAWMSMFDRAMVSAVLWVAVLVVWHRRLLLRLVADRTRELECKTEELTRSNEELDRFASVVAHDLRGPLNAMGLVARLLADHPLDEESSQWITGIGREIDRMSQLIQRLLTYGRAGRGALIRERCDCNAALESATAALGGALGDAVVTHDPLPVLRADSLLISELFQNLLENAIKYRGAAQPRIHVSAAAAEKQWMISVSDNGIGIDNADRQAIFRPFTQLTSTGPCGGVGLGLATCKRIVERHHGTLAVESARGKGSTFIMTLPAGDAVEPAEAVGAGRSGR